MIDVRTSGVAAKVETTSEAKEGSELGVGRSLQRQWYLIDPRTSKCYGHWEGVTALALLYVAIVTPYEVALLPTAESFSDPLLILNRLIDR